MSSRTLAILSVAALFSIVLAQDLVAVGSMNGTIEEDPFELVISEGAIEGATISNAYWNQAFGGLDVTLIGQSRPSLFSFTAGAMMLDFYLSGPPWECPCAAQNVSLFYAPEGGFARNVYDDLEAEATVESVEELTPGAYRIVGSFTAVLGFKEGITDRPDPERTVRIVGTFAVERLAEEEETP